MNNNIPLGNDLIELALPMNPAYVSAARLTVSSIANRMGFNIEDIEDIKAAVSEACTYLIKQNMHTSPSKIFKIQFKIIQDSLEIILTSDKNPKVENQYADDSLGILMIEALMDKIDVFEEDEKLKISMIKNMSDSFTAL